MFNAIFGKFSRMWGVVVILTILASSLPVFAIDSKMQMTGASFSNACTRTDESWISFCNGYIQAVVDSIRKDDKICLPKGTSRTDLVTITEKEITASSRLRAMNAHDAVLSVMQRFYPCQ